MSEINRSSSSLPSSSSLSAQTQAQLAGSEKISNNAVENKLFLEILELYQFPGELKQFINDPEMGVLQCDDVLGLTLSDCRDFFGESVGRVVSSKLVCSCSSLSLIYIYIYIYTLSLSLSL